MLGVFAAVVKLLISIDQRGSAGIWSCAATIFIFLASLEYLWGALHTFTFPDPRDTCSLSPREGSRWGGLERIDYGIFPPSAKCVWGSGNTSDLVPGHVAPLLYAFLTAALVCAAAAKAARIARRNRRSPS
ncbi:hypothetical protein J2S53_002902 [Actinopolyspora lacussalsi]|nr:hypothetical protein [Actinopolyspora lacussalsi]